MHESIADTSTATSLYWLAYILTGCEETSISVTAEVLFMEPGNPRRAVIVQSIAAKESELRSALKRNHQHIDCEFDCRAATEREARPDFRQVRDALLAIELFPRYALLLTVFEGYSVHEAATCLGCNEQSICEARTVGLLALARNMALVPTL